MKINATVAALAGALSIAVTLSASEAHAQVVPPAVQPIVPRDSGWNTVSNMTMVISAATVLFMPRVYFSDPESTVGWKGRWHFSVLAPAMSMTALTLLVDGPLKGAIKSPRPGCNQDQTDNALPQSGCESYGGPSTQSYAAWGATGVGLGTFLVDTVKYSNGRFNVPYFIGEFAVPFTASMVTSIGRGVSSGTSTSYESGGQILAGALTGVGSGLILGVAYSMFQRPNCGYGNALFCW